MKYYGRGGGRTIGRSEVAYDRETRTGRNNTAVPNLMKAANTQRLVPTQASNPQGMTTVSKTGQKCA